MDFTRRKVFVVGLFLMLLCIIADDSLGQDLSAIGNQPPMRVSGGINVNQIFYGISGQESRRDPYTYYVSGNLNLDIYGLSLPFSYSFSNQNSTFQQPFNQYSLHPSYKWISGHLGYTSMTFSPYSLNGHLFLGAGLDLQPTDKIRISLMYGRLQRAVEPDTTEAANIPAFRRMGYGIKAIYGTNADNIGITLFRAKDDESSLPYVPEDEGVLPEENLVLGLSGSKSLFDKFILKAELATTAITRDIRAEEYKSSDNSNPLSKVSGVYTPRTSSSYYNAFNSSFSYQAGKYSLGISYERIDPGYRTLGAYYFNNDLESIALNAATSIFNGKVNLAADVGTQRDNLDGEKISEMSRLTSAFNVTYTPNDRLNMGLSYSNFKSFTNIRSQFVQINELTPYDNLDTLNYRQISQSTSVNANYVFNSKSEVKSALNVNFTYQTSDDEQGGVEQPTGADFYNINTAYSLNFPSQKTVLAVAFNANHNNVAQMSTKTFGPTANLTKSLLQQKLRASLSASWNNSYTNGDQVSQVMNIRAGGSYTLKKSHSFNLSVVGIKRMKKAETGSSGFTEFTATVGYNYNFNR